MKTITWITCSLLLMAVVAESSLAQSRIRPPRRSPSISPYIELFRNNGGGTAFNYFQRVRPQQQILRDRQQFSRQISGLRQRQRRFENSVDQALNPTGHTTSFLNYGSYYPSAGR